MNANYSKLLTKIVGILGVTGVSCLAILPTQAEEIKNTEHKNKTYISQSLDNGILNPRPSIFNEPPYNGGRRTPGVTPTPTTPTPTTPTPTAEPTATEGKNIVEVAKEAGSFTTLIKAIEAAGLVEVLQGNGAFTVFAPTDEAFAQLPPDALADLLKPENKEVLVKILTYHVVSGNVKSTDLKSGEVKSLQGDPIKVTVNEDKTVMVNDGTVVQADIPASNGVIHIINTVILPPSL